ncbi:cupin domain-containing protein [Rhizobium sp. RCAM05350]|nr:cupin domain-containing protein [Rhizobium sp. RCAM05350]
MQTVTKLATPVPADGDPAILDGWVVVAGTPSMKTWALHTSSDSSMVSGYWEATPGTYHATYTAYEFVHMIAGKIIITPDGGTPVTVAAGDAFVVEADFKGTWEIVETVRKHF